MSKPLSYKEAHPSVQCAFGFAALRPTYCSVLSKWEFFIKIRAALRAPILPRVMKEGESKKAALILMKNSHFDRTLRYGWWVLFYSPEIYLIFSLKTMISLFNWVGNEKPGWSQAVESCRRASRKTLFFSVPHSTFLVSVSRPLKGVGSA